MKRIGDGETKFVEMIHPKGHIVPIAYGPRHRMGQGEAETVALFRARGFKTKDDVKAEQRIADLEARIAKAEKPGK